MHHDLEREEKSELLTNVDLHIKRSEEELTLLTIASPLGHLPTALLQALLDGFASNFQNGFGRGGDHVPKPLAHWAAEHGRRDLLEFLRRQDESLIHTEDRHGRKPLYYAGEAGHTGLVYYFSEGHVAVQRPDPNSLPEMYRSILLHVESEGWDSIAWKDGFTMLHWAADKGDVELCRYLLSEGADPWMQDNLGRAPIDFARRAGNLNLVNLLQAKICRSELSSTASKDLHTNVQRSAHKSGYHPTFADGEAASSGMPLPSPAF